MIEFSIIIPHYNIPDCLERLLLSIPIKENLEVIIVDDKSDKNIELFEQCKEKYQNENCRFYYNNTYQKGAGVCRNIGVNKARGKWLLFADSDDFFTDDMYSIISDNTEREEDTIFFFPCSIVLETGEESDRHVEFCDVLSKYDSSKSFEDELVLRYQVVSPWSKMIRSSMVKDNNIEFEGTKVANDVLFCRKIGYHSRKIAVDRRTIYCVTERQGSLVTNISKEAYYTRLDVFLRSSNYVRSVVDKVTWKKINVNGRYFMHMCKINRLGISTMIGTVCRCIRNRISPV